MYCPKCSQLQSSGEMRFCSRCGFALAGVAMLMDNAGVVPQPAGVTIQKLPSSRKKVMVESAIFTVVCWAVLIVATAWFDFGGAFETMAKIAALLFFLLSMIGLLRFLYGFLFVKDVIVQPAPNAVPGVAGVAPPGFMSEAPGHAALNPQREAAVTDYPRRSNTKEMMPQPSVTENTTRLLEEPIDRDY